jgi:hypothetical protein
MTWREIIALKALGSVSEKIWQMMVRRETHVVLPSPIRQSTTLTTTQTISEFMGTSLLFTFAIHFEPGRPLSLAKAKTCRLVDASKLMELVTIRRMRMLVKAMAPDGEPVAVMKSSKNAYPVRSAVYSSGATQQKDTVMRVATTSPLLIQYDHTL